MIKKRLVDLPAKIVRSTLGRKYAKPEYFTCPIQAERDHIQEEYQKSIPPQDRCFPPCNDY